MKAKARERHEGIIFEISVPSDIFNELYNDFLSELGVNTTRIFAVDCHGETLVIARNQAGEISGIASFFAPNQFLHVLYVLPRARRTQVGTELLKIIQKKYGTVFRLKCLASNKSARAFYLALGFEVVGGGTNEDGDYETLEINNPI